MMPLLQKQKKKDGIAGVRVMSRAYALMNTLIKDIFNDILDLEEKALQYCNVKDLSITEMHVLEVIGDEDGRTMSEAAMVGPARSATKPAGRGGTCWPRHTSGVPNRREFERVPGLRARDWPAG